MVSTEGAEVAVWDAVSVDYGAVRRTVLDALLVLKIGYFAECASAFTLTEVELW